MSSDPIRAALERWHGLMATDLLCPDNPAQTDWGAVASAAAQTRAALATAPTGDEPAVPEEGREPAAVADDSIELRVQRLEERTETQRAALLDAFQQIDRLKERVDSHYLKIHKMEEATCDPAAPASVEGEVGELVEWLWNKGRGAWPCPDGFSPDAQAEEYELFSRLTRAAALLQQQATELAALRPASPPAPVEGEVGELVQYLEQAAEGAAAMGHGLDSWAIATGAWLIRRWSTGADCFHTGAMPHPYQPPQSGEGEG